MKETSIIILVLIAVIAALFAYNEYTGGEIEDIAATTIAKDQIIEARIPKATAALTAATVEKATGVKYAPLDRETTGKVLSIQDISATAGENQTVVLSVRYVTLQDLETDVKYCVELNESVELTQKGKILTPGDITEGSYLKVIPA